MNQAPEYRMEKYQIIAKKFRPQTFKKVCGQEAIVRALKNAILMDRLANAYLFCGSRGTGKTTLARILAKAINCESPSSDQEPCNTCASCREITSGHSLDVIEIDGASNRGIDDIRQINETVGYAPAAGKYKVYIIDEVHMLTKEAFNALLKTLEEPPPHVKFFFATTEAHKVLPTIISRCQRYDLSRLSTQAVCDKLKLIGKELGVTAEDEALYTIATLSEGSLRDAESLFDQVICLNDDKITYETVKEMIGLQSNESFFKLDIAIHEKNLSFAFELSEELFSSGSHLVHFVENLAEHYRNLLQIKLHGTKAAFDTEKYQASAKLYSTDHCLYLLDYLAKWIQELHTSSFKRINIEMILLHLLQSKDRVSIDALVQRLSELEGKAPLEPVPPPVEKKEPIAVAPPPVEKKEPEADQSFFEKQHRYDTVMRFASVELNGSVKK